MKTNRNLLWITLVGLAVAIFWWAIFLNNPAGSISPQKHLVKVGLISSAFLDPVPSNPQTNPVQPSDLSIVKTDSPPPAEDDPEKVAGLIRSMSETEVFLWLAKLSNQDLTGNTGRLLLRRLVELDPSAAVNWVTQLPDSGVRQELLDVAAIAWSQKNLPEALAWVESLPESAAKFQALADLGYEVARLDPINAMQIATQLPASDYAEGLLLHALTQYASADPQQAQQLALSLPPGSLRNQALASVATVQAQQDGAGAAQFAVDNIPPGPNLDRAVMGVVQMWGQINMTDVSAWVLSFPDSPLRDQAVYNLGINAH